MLKRLLQGCVIALAIVLVPVLGNLDVLRAPHMWILVLLGILASLFQPPHNPLTIVSKAADGGTGAQILWSIYVTQILAVVEATYLRYPASMRWDLTASFAAVAVLLGFILRTWAIGVLGSFFTMHIAASSDQPVIRRGPYRMVRHPSYLGALISYIATTILLHAWFSASLAVLLLPLAFVRRIHHEEKLLKNVVGGEYISYSRSVKRLIPGIW